MTELSFDTLSEAKKYFDSREGQMFVHKKFYDLISAAIDTKKKTLNAFIIYIESSDNELDVFLPRSDWESTLEVCLKTFEEFEMSDEVIDCYLLQKKFSK
jgi:hypothetical protein